MMMQDGAATIIDDITLLHSLCIPAGDIAARLHLPPETVRHVLRTGELPQPEPQWVQGELFGQPDPSRTISHR